MAKKKDQKNPVADNDNEPTGTGEKKPVAPEEPTSEKPPGGEPLVIEHVVHVVVKRRFFVVAPSGEQVELSADESDPSGDSVAIHTVIVPTVSIGATRRA